MRVHDELAFGAARNERDFDRHVENRWDPLRDHLQLQLLLAGN